MAINPKLEFYRFKLNPKDKEVFKTFRDFAIDELKAGKNPNDEKVVKTCFKHFIESLDGPCSKDNKLKKQIVLIKKQNVNKHFDKRPTYSSERNIIYGVINGGPYGRDRILSDIDNQDESSILGQNKSVLLYFYFLLYLPTDHDEGCFIIHSNGIDESITRIFRGFISKIFKGRLYNNVQCMSFCPKSFQEEFKKGAILESMIFKESFVENIHTKDGVAQLLQKYDVIIKAIPKDKTFSISEVLKVKDFFSKKLFGNKDNPKKLYDFDQTKIATKNPVTDSKKIFEWSNKDNEFVPVIYLKGRIQKLNPDGTPDFGELGQLCLNYFNDEVLPEIRPDLYVTKT